MKHHRRSFLTLVLLAAVLLAAGCSRPREAVSTLDTPAHHALRGNDFLDRGDLDNAARSFDMALSLNKEHSPALAGKAVTLAMQSAVAGKDQRRKLADSADDFVSQARKRAKDDDERRGALSARIRVLRLTKQPSKWLQEAEEDYQDAVKLDKRRIDPDPAFFMAQAYRDAFNLQKAGDLYREVLSMNRGRTQAADAEMAVVQKIQRAEPGSLHGKAVAFQAALTRADISALLVEELQLARLYERGNTARFDTSFRAPGQGGQADQLKNIPEATDINDHAMRSDIQEVMRLKVVGLEPNADRKFHPNEKITRAEFALIIEDVLVRVTGEQKLKTRFIGQNSPFPDVRNDAFYFNAVQTVVSRNLMEPKNRVQGIFGPQDAVAGVDALLVLRLLKDELKGMVR